MVTVHRNYRTLTFENVSPEIPVRQTQDATRDTRGEGGREDATRDTRGEGGRGNLPQSSSPSSSSPLFEPPRMSPRDGAASGSCTAVAVGTGAAGAGADSAGSVRGTSAGRTEFQDEETLAWRLRNYYQVCAPYLVDRAPRYTLNPVSPPGKP
jgi:hypothetical protein